MDLPDDDFTDLLEGLHNRGLHHVFRTPVPGNSKYDQYQYLVSFTGRTGETLDGLLNRIRNFFNHLNNNLFYCDIRYAFIRVIEEKVTLHYQLTHFVLDEQDHRSRHNSLLNTMTEGSLNSQANTAYLWVPIRAIPLREDQVETSNAQRPTQSAALPNPQLNSPPPQEEIPLIDLSTEQPQSPPNTGEAPSTTSQEQSDCNQPSCSESHFSE